MAGFNSLNKGGNGGGDGGGGLPGGSSINPFGSLYTSEQYPSAQGTFVFGVNSTLWVTSSVGAGALVAAVEGIVTCSSGNSTSGSASVRSRRGIKYRAGQGGICKFTAIFDPGVAGSSQVAGIGNPDSGYYFGRSGTNFGIFHNTAGKREIRKLTISAAGGTENVTITLNGIAKTFAIAGGSNINQTSFLISGQDFTQLGYGWDAEAIDGDIYFVSNRARGDLTGSYGITTSGTASGSFSIIQSGINTTSAFITQSQWNVDPMNGNGESRVTLNPAKGNIYSIGYQYLGFGNAIFAVEDPNKGIFVPVHQIKNANSRDTIVLRDPHMFARWSVVNNGSSTSVSLKGASAATFVEGQINRNIGTSFATGSVKSSIGTSIVPILSIRANQVFNNQACYGEIDPYNISVGADFNNAANTDLLNVYVYRNATLTGPVNFQYVNSSLSTCATDFAATGITITGATLVKSFTVAANNAATLTLNASEFYVGFRETLTIAANTTGNTAKVTANLSWYEDQ